MGWVINATPRLLYPQKRPGTHCMGGWVGPRAGLDGCGKSRPPPGFDPRTVQPVASRYSSHKTERCSTGRLYSRCLRDGVDCQRASMHHSITLLRCKPELFFFHIPTVQHLDIIKVVFIHQLMH